MISRTEWSVDSSKCSSECGRTSSRRLGFPRLKINVVLWTHSKTVTSWEIAPVSRPGTRQWMSASAPWSSPRSVTYEILSAVGCNSWLATFSWPTVIRCILAIRWIDKFHFIWIFININLIRTSFMVMLLLVLLLLI